MTRLNRIGIALAAVVGLLVLTAGPALADNSMSVAAPGEAGIGDIVPVLVSVTEDGSPVTGVVVVLRRNATFAGVSGYVEIARATTSDEGAADLSYVQRGAAQTSELRVEVLDFDVAQLDFAVTSVGEAEQIFEPEVGLNLPGLGGWMLIALIGGLWTIILSTVLRLIVVSTDGDESSTGVPPRRRLLPFVLSGMVGLIAIVLVTVLVRNPATHANLDGPGESDRVPHSHLAEITPFNGPGLDEAYVELTGDALVDGARAFFGLGCASCHGLDAESGVVGGDIDSVVRDGFDEFLSAVRKGPEGMPKYTADAFSEEELIAIHTYLATVDGE